MQKKKKTWNERLQGLIYQDQNIKKLAWLILAKVIKSDSNVWYPGGRSGYLWKKTNLECAQSQGEKCL